MSSYRHFDAQDISDLIAYMRSFHAQRNDRDTSLAMVDAADHMVSADIGQTLYRSNCVTCHGDHGQGDLGPSINNQAFLTVIDNDYLYDALTAGRPGTGMPAWRHLSNEDVASLIRYIRTWQIDPSRELPTGRIAGDPEIGQLIYSRACASCHGAQAEGSLGTQLRNRVLLGSASDAMLRQWIAYGKPGTPMLGFLKGEQGPVELSSSQIDDIVAYLRSLELEPSMAKNPNGRPELGEQWYANACASCHGDRGEGGSGPSLSNPRFLEAVSDGFLLATLALGRDGTEMRPVKKGAQSILSLSSDQVNDVVTFIRSWESDPPYEPGRDIPHNFVIPWDLARGQRLYESHCAGCHGVNGKADIAEQRLSAWAPQLNNPGFLRAATDGYLQATIVRGRIGTAMRPFGVGMHGVADLTSEQIDDIVAFIRRWSPDPASPMTIPAGIVGPVEQIAQHKPDSHTSVPGE
jgi:mono/diheme cytochrome c family protein